jgi:Plasmid encoded RepA protein
MLSCLHENSQAMTERGKTGLVRAGDILPEIFPADLFDEVIRPEDVGYTHPVFLQCFMPLRHNRDNQERWQTDCGRASLVMRAGELVKPGKLNEFKKCIVPAGPKARILNAYINDYILRKRTATVPLGETMRDAMERMNISIGGKNGKELQRELENFAAAEIILGVWDKDGNAHQEQTKIARRLSFWIERNPNQKVFWQPELTVSGEYYNAITEPDRMAPYYWPALVALQHNPRAMDIHCFLVYRLRNGLKRPVVLHAKVLHAMFGGNRGLLKHFWPEFKKALAEAHKFYPKAIIELKSDCIILKDSPPLIPYRKMARLSHPPGA